MLNASDEKSRPTRHCTEASVSGSLSTTLPVTGFHDFPQALHALAAIVGSEMWLHPALEREEPPFFFLCSFVRICVILNFVCPSESAFPERENLTFGFFLSYSRASSSVILSSRDILHSH